MVFDLLLIGVVIAIEPIPLTAFILVLSAEHGIRKSVGFIIGWLLSLVGVIVITLAITDNDPPPSHSTSSVLALVAKLLLGAGLVVFGVQKRKRLGQPKKPPRWMNRLDDLSMWTAAILAFLVQPWGLVAAGALTIVNAKISTPLSW